jgi:hypothetical protein
LWGGQFCPQPAFRPVSDPDPSLKDPLESVSAA